MKILVTAASACMGAFQGVLAALLAWHLLLGMRARDGSGHAYALAAGALVGAALGWAFARQGRMRGAYLFTIWVRCALVGGGLASCRLGLLQLRGHVPTAVVFLAWGALLCLVGGLVVLAAVLDAAPIEKAASSRHTGQLRLGTATYAALALTILLVGSYRSGERHLSFRKADVWGRADCLRETRGWFGLVSVERSRLSGVRDWRPAFREEEGVALVSDEGEMFVEGDVDSDHSLAGMIGRVLGEFLGSSSPALRLAERASYPFWVYAISAGLLVAAGVLFDPLVPSRLKGLVCVTPDG